MVSCKNCFKHHHNVIAKDCSICQTLAFDEAILCSLLQPAKNDVEIDCFAYKHNLSVVVADDADADADNAVGDNGGNNDDEKSNTVLLDNKGNNKDNNEKGNKEDVIWGDKQFQMSNKHKWLKALALQKLSFSPDQIITDLSFHICLVTRAREPLFLDTDTDLSSIFSEAGSLFDGHLEVLSYAKDHIHLYANTSPDFSIDDVVNKALSFAEPKIKEAYPELFKEKKTLFEKAYFAETIA